MSKKMTLEKYARLLAGAGFHEREVARAVTYVAEYGFGALDGEHAVFHMPTCPEGWNCLNPAHQRLLDHDLNPIQHLLLQASLEGA